MSRYTKHLVALLALLGALALVAAGCGGDGNGDSDAVEASNGDSAVEVTDGGAEASGAQAGDMVAAMAFINDAGFHDMSEALAEGKLEAGYLGTVRGAQGVLAAIEWPDSIATDVEAFSSDVEALETALANEKQKAAAAASSAVHESQHAFSDSVLEALAEAPQSVDVAGVLGAVNIVSGAGFHEMSETLAQEGIEPNFLDKVRGVNEVVTATAWPDSITEQVDAFGSDLKALEDALANENQKAAAEAGDAVHESQHAFSGAAVGELGSLSGGSEIAQAVAGITYLDAVGFHDMSEALAGGEIEPQYLEQVRGAIAVTQAVGWSGELAGPMQQFQGELAALESALADEAVSRAAEAGEGVHASQHSISDGLLAMLGVELEDAHADAGSGGGEVISVEISDWAFEQPTITVPEGDVTLELVNRGEMPHGVYLSEFKVNESVAAGETKEITFHADEAGTFQFLCNDPMCGTAAQHAGMIGQLVVE
ncbi:MAG TPA: cupredoxin domain-containing protein [Solirubrobacterales bacterium]|nr:cupredoxin domain-containing protein [Solirubrobacterales bacterium]